MTERELMAAVRELSKWLGFLAYHTHDSRRSPEGFPDLVIAGHGRAIFIELKADRGRVTPAQQAWLHALQAAACEVFVWRPEHWRSGEIEEELRRPGNTCFRSPRVHVPPRRQEGERR